MGHDSEERGGTEDSRTNDGVYGRHMTIEERRTTDSPILPVCEIVTLLVVIFGCVVPGIRRILLGDRMNLEIRNDRREKEQNIHEYG